MSRIPHSFSHQAIGGATRASPRLTPQYAFTFAAAAAGAAAVLCIWLVLQAPWFGVQLDTSPERVGQVTKVDASAAAAGLQVGAQVLAFAAPGAEPVPLQPLSLVSDLDQTGSFAARHELFAHLDALHAATREDSTQLHLADGRIVTLARSDRPLSSLPAGLWVMVGGVVPFLVGAGVWSFRRRGPATRLLLLAGTSFMGIALTNLLYAYRQPSIDPLLLELAVHGNRLSTLLFFFAYLALFWVYPRALGSGRVVVVGLAVTGLLFVNELTQTVHWPGDPFAFPLVVSLPLSALLIGLQWWHSRRYPVDRAALQWFVLAMMTGMVLVTGLYFLPGLVGAPPMLSLELAFAVGVISYLGLMLAVVRYRLFQLGQWWLTAWLWLLGGTAVVALDVFLAYLLNVAPAHVIALSMFVVGWVYFPLRQWFWRRLFWHGEAPMAWLPTALLEAVVAARGDSALSANWHALLDKLFRPLHLEPLPGPVPAPSVGEEGLRLRVPDLGGGAGVELAFRSGGRRLFGPADVELVSTLLQMAGPAVDARAARQAATQRERERIMRDLHDDVGARLLTLSHRLHEPDDAEMIRRAMQALRETIYSLNRPEGVELACALADWRHELLERLDGTDVTLQWQVDESLPPLSLSAAQRANLGQVLREAVSNALRHARPTRLRVAVRHADGLLHLEVHDDGHDADPSAWSPGAGITNMRRRMQALNGRIDWQGGEAGSCVQLALPVQSVAGSAGPMAAPNGSLHEVKEPTHAR